MGTVAIKRPLTVLLSDAHAEGLGQQLSDGRQWQWLAMAGAARATMDANVHFMVQEVGMIRLSKMEAQMSITLLLCIWD